MAWYTNTCKDLNLIFSTFYWRILIPTISLARPEKKLVLWLRAFILTGWHMCAQTCDTSPNTFIHFERAWVPKMQSLLYTKICMTMSILVDCLILHNILGMITHHVSVVCWRLWTVLTEVSDLKPYDLYMSALRWILFYKSSHRSVSQIH